jgi:hypothetical protein
MMMLSNLFGLCQLMILLFLITLTLPQMAKLEAGPISQQSNHCLMKRNENVV